MVAQHHFQILSRAALWATLAWLSIGSPCPAQLAPLGGPALGGSALPRTLPGDLPTSAADADEGQVEPRGPVLGVAISGNKRVKETEIRRHIQTRQDRPYDPHLVQEDLRRLFSTRKFHNVRVHKRVVPQGVYVTFEVLERPTVDEVLFIGNRYASDKRLKKECGLASGEALNIYTVQEACRKIEDYYRTSGMPKTRVTVLEGTEASDQRIVLQIDEGPVERIWTVRFVGNDPSLVTDARLATLVKSKPGFMKYLFRGRVDHTLIAEDIDRLTVYYRNLGYFRAVVSRSLSYDDSNQWATLTFVIDEGPRYQIRNLEVVGNEKFTSEQLKETLSLKSGDFFNMPKMQADQNALRELYGSQGHIFADIKATPRFMQEPGQLDLVYEIKEGELFRVGEINVHVAGDYPHTRKSVILNRLSLRPGDIIDIREVRASERRLKSSQLFVTNPTEGEPPRIVIRPPNVDEAARIAKQRNTTYYRGQNPARQDSTNPVRDMVLDVIAQPVAIAPSTTR